MGARGWAYFVGLQHPKGVDAAPGAASARRKLRMKARPRFRIAFSTHYEAHCSALDPCFFLTTSTLLFVHFRIISDLGLVCVIVLVQHFALLISFHAHCLV